MNCWVIAAQQTLGDSSCQQTMEGRVTILGDENPNIAPINLKKNTWKKVTHPNLSEDPIFRDLDSQGKINIPQKKVHSENTHRIWHIISTLAVPSKSKIHAGKYTSPMRRLTWNLKIQTWKRKIIIFRFYVNLRGCSPFLTLVICVSYKSNLSTSSFQQMASENHQITKSPHHFGKERFWYTPKV